MRRIARPAVMAIALREHPESVHETVLDDRIDAFTLFFGKSMSALISFGVGQIVRRMRYVEVPAEYDRLLLLQELTVSQESGVPELVAQIEPAEVGLGIRGIYIHEEEVLGFGWYDAPFRGRIPVTVGKMVFFQEFQREPQNDAERLLFRENGGAAVPLARGRRVPVFLILRKVNRGLALLSLGFLQTEDVGLQSCHRGDEQAFSMHRTQSIDVPRDQSHCRMIPNPSHERHAHQLQ